MAIHVARFCVAVLAIVALFAAGTPATAQTDDLEALNKRIGELYSAGKYGDAIPLAERSLALTRALNGEEHLDTANGMGRLAALYRALGRLAEAEPLYKRDLAITEKALGPEHPDVATALNNLAVLYGSQGRYAEAASLYKRDLAITEKALGPEHPDVAATLNNLAGLYRSLGRYAEAEPLYRRSLSIREKALGPEHPDFATTLNSLALLYGNQGRYAEAESLYKRDLAITEKAHGPEHPDVATTLNNLALLYESQGLTAEAEPLYRRSLAVYEKALGPEHPDVATAVNNLALLYESQGLTAEAEALYRRSLSIREKALGPEHPDVGQSLNNLALLYGGQGRIAEAELLYRRSLGIREKALGPEHPDVGQSLNNLALLYGSQGRTAEAELLYRRSLGIREKALGLDHPDVATSLNNLAALYLVQRDWARAAEFWRRSTALTVRRVQRRTAEVQSSSKGKSEANQLEYRFRGLVKVVHRLATSQPGTDAGVPPVRFRQHTAEMFATAQWAKGSEAARSLTQMAARGAAGNPALASVVRERQDLVGEWQRRDGAHVAAVSQPPEKRNREAEAANVARMAEIDARIADIDRRLAAEFPDYAALASPQPSTVEQVQADLRPDEALLLFLDTDDRFKPIEEETFVWIVTKTGVRWVRSGLGTKALAREVAVLRCGLDHTLWTDPSARPDTTEQENRPKMEQAARRQRCLDLVKREPEYAGDGSALPHTLPFNATRAHALYKSLFGEVENLIRGKHLLIVPSGALTSLPFNVLVTTPPPTAMPATPADYRKLSWLGARQPITTLPAVSSLNALRQHAKASRAARPYLGVGNPLLDGGTAARVKEARDKRACTTPKTMAQKVAAKSSGPLVGFASLFKRGAPHADIEDVRAWSPLPETADELCTIAGQLGAASGEVVLGERATEKTVKALSESGRLAEFRIVHFATHGALTGEVKGAAEPGLILTPPPKGTIDTAALDRDDGFLTASEIAGLKLDADWVILSACNTAGPAASTSVGGTASGSGENAEALTGLARAFFYAGARALLVSHWEVASHATVKLTTRAFAELTNRPGIGRAEALRVSMRELIDKGEPWEAHPSQWAPFVVVGEGGAAR